MEPEIQAQIIKKGKQKYVKIKEKGKRARTYKYDGKTSLRTYKKRYEASAKYGDRYTIEQYKQELKELRKKAREIERIPSITGSIKTGKNTAKLRDVHRMTEKAARTLYRQLLKPVIKERGKIREKLLDILTEESNIKKIRNNLEITLYIKDAKGETLDTISRVGTTPKEAKREVITKSNGAMNKGRETSTDLYSTTNKEYREHIISLRKKGYQYEHITTGRIHHIEIEVTFRRA